MSWTWLDSWIVVTGMLSAVACALPGCFLVLRRMSMMGDAISHAVLPGLALAFLFTHSRESLPMFLGAALVGVLTAVFIEWVHRLGKVEESASMGVVFTTLFAIGLVLIVRAADTVDLDPGCVLYGAVELAPLDTWRALGLELPRAVWVLGAVTLGNLAFVKLFFKELEISTFDPALATTLGINATAMHYALMAVVAMTTVAAFESVGSILVIAMLIVPGATAYLLTDRLGTMLWLSVAVAAVGAGLGHVAAITVPTWFGYPDTSTAGMMAVVTGTLFGLAALFAPRHGLVSKMLHRLALSLQIVREDMLSLLYRLEEAGLFQEMARPAELEKALNVGPFLRILAAAGLKRRGLVGSDLALTCEGREKARALVRSHRLWEVYLHQVVNLPADHVHETAHRLEHVTDRSRRRQLGRVVKETETDPHGSPIPPE